MFLSIVYSTTKQVINSPTRVLEGIFFNYMDTKKKIFVTKQGLEELKNELHDLEKVKRPQVLERVSQARAMGDLSENSEYTAAREELSLIDGRTEELADMFKRVEIIEEEKSSKGHSNVKLGSKVTVTVNGKKEYFEW